MQIYLRRAQMFFDRAPVIQAMNRARRRSLARAGGWIRQTARRSMRRVKHGAPPSPPGTPPRARAGQIRDLLFFGWDQATESVVAGPEEFNSSRSDYLVPELLEKGGTVRLPPRRPRPGEEAKGAGPLVTFPPRPTMGLALDQALDKNVIPEMFRNSIRSS